MEATTLVPKAALTLTKRAISGLVLGLSLNLLVGVRAEAITFNFTKIADTNTPIPGSTGNFALLDLTPFLDKGVVVFTNISSSGEGIYLNVGGSLNVVADTNTAIPGGTGNFRNFDLVWLDNGYVAFRGNVFTQQPGIYTNVGGSLNVVADTNTVIPGSTENFAQFGYPSLDNGIVAFSGNGINFLPSGIYTNTGGSLNVVVDSNTAIPGGTGNFRDFAFVSLDNGNVAFKSFFGYQDGIYTNVGSSLNVVADTNTAVPGGTGNFTGFSYVSFDKINVSFTGFSSGTQGIYTNLGGSLNIVADTNTAIPGSIENFFGFGQSAIDNENVAFVAADSSFLVPSPKGGFQTNFTSGIYTNLGGSLTKVLTHNDSLDGKIIDEVVLGTNALSGNQIAFYARFTDDSRGIYVATATSTPTSVPESSSTLGVLAIGAFGVGFLLKRKQKQQQSASGVTSDI